MSKDESAVKLANIIINSELHNRSTLDIDEVYEEVADIVKNIYNAGFRDVEELKKKIQKLQDKDGMLVLLKDEVSELLESL